MPSGFEGAQITGYSKNIHVVLRLLPLSWRTSFRFHRMLHVWPPVGWIRFGALRRTAPISRLFGFERGLCIDRYYVEQFLLGNATQIKGRVLEVADNAYTQKFGGSRVIRSDVLNVMHDKPGTTIVGDLTCPTDLPIEVFDCAIVTQTLHLIYDVHAAVTSLAQMLKPGGILLATMPGISQVSRYDAERWGDYWRFTNMSAEKLFEAVFPPANITVRAYGNVLTALAFLHGLAADDLRPEELEVVDPDYQVLITVKAKKPGTQS